MSIVQISYVALDHISKERALYPFLFSPVPSDFKTITQLLKHFGWTWVGILGSADDNSQQTSQNLKKELMENGICVEFLTILQTDSIDAAISKIHRSTANVIILYLTVHYLILMAQRQSNNPIYGKVWIFSVNLDISADGSLISYVHAFNGSLMVTISKGEISGFKIFLSNVTLTNITDNVFIEIFWVVKFGCMVSKEEDYWTDCGIDLWKESLSKEEANSYCLTYTVYSSVYYLAQALHKLLHTEGFESSVSAIKVNISNTCSITPLICTINTKE